MRTYRIDDNGNRIPHSLEVVPLQRAKRLSDTAIKNPSESERGVWLGFVLVALVFGLGLVGGFIAGRWWL